jgi:two-component system, NarL family, sensor histidine kinase UhpB
LNAPGGDRPLAPAADRPIPAPLRALLRVPLFYKILIANALIVLAGTMVVAAIVRAYERQEHGAFSSFAFVLVLALTGVAVTVLVNAVILRLALTQLKLLEQTAARVQRGDLDARVPQSAVTDRDLERLTRTFNRMLTNLAAYRRRLRDVAARALSAEEAERKRISRELHDDTAQTLAALLIRLRVARAATDAEARDALLEQFRAEVVEALERVRRFARGLRPPALDELGLVPALESHVRGVEEGVGLPVRMEVEPLDGLLNPQCELALYRIAQEALSNAVRHSGTERVELRLARAGENVELTVTDTGRGFEVQRAMSDDGGGLGLFGMQERAAYVGGEVLIESLPGSGTTVRATIPVAEAAAESGSSP